MELDEATMEVRLRQESELQVFPGGGAKATAPEVVVQTVKPSTVELNSWRQIGMLFGQHRRVCNPRPHDEEHQPAIAK